MATATAIHFSTQHEAQFAVPDLTAGSAQKATELLQDNHDKNDIIFTDFGLHNHTVHHICTSFALGATPEALQKSYDVDDAYQRRPPPLDEQLLTELKDPRVFVSKMGTKTKFYSAFLELFTQEIQQKGYQQVLSEYVFSGDERANVIFKRLFAGYLHPLIHLGFGLEFEQPALVAEALGQTCIHPTFLDPFFDEIDAYVEQKNPTAKSLTQIITEIQDDAKLKVAAHWDDDHKVRDGIMKRAKDEMVAHAASWRVSPDNLDEAAAEMVNACVYFGGAAQHPPKEINFDFYYMHAINSSIFFPMLVKFPWISTENKVKLLEYKGRLDMCLYASRRAPPLLLDEITDYKPKHARSDWNTLFARACEFGDDGHAAKFVRALANGERVCKPFETSARFRIKDNMWLQLGNMVMDSVESTGAVWIRSAGFEEAWKDSKDRS